MTVDFLILISKVTNVDIGTLLGEENKTRLPIKEPKERHDLYKEIESLRIENSKLKDKIISLLEKQK